MSMSDLADQIVLTPGGVTRLVDRLGEAGWVERIPCPSDRRVQWAHLTEAGGEALVAATETHLGDLETHFSGKVDAGELTVLNTVLDRLRSI
jgi:DNA-binding MarR family transcriptional regulator